MKSNLKSILLLCALCASVVLLPACKSPPSRIIYNTEAAVVITVDKAMSAWGAYVAKYHPPVEQEQKVEAAFTKYQRAMVLAIDAAQGYVALTAAHSTNAPSGLITSTALQHGAAQALADLVDLIRLFGVTVN